MRNYTQIINFLLENDGETQEFRVWLSRTPSPNNEEWTFQVPNGYVNYAFLPSGLAASEQQRAVENHMRLLVKNRDYPAGSFFTTPWGLYLIHGGTIGKI